MLHPRSAELEQERPGLVGQVPPHVDGDLWEAPLARAVSEPELVPGRPDLDRRQGLPRARAGNAYPVRGTIERAVLAAHEKSSISAHRRARPKIERQRAVSAHVGVGAPG